MDSRITSRLRFLVYGRLMLRRTVASGCLQEEANSLDGGSVLGEVIPRTDRCGSAVNGGNVHVSDIGIAKLAALDANGRASCRGAADGISFRLAAPASFGNGALPFSARRRHLSELVG